MRKTASPAEPAVTPARRRLLDTATRLFYAEGIHAVGINRIIAEAGVAKATFYNHVRSREDSVLAYVEEQDQLGRDAVAARPQAACRAVRRPARNRLSGRSEGGSRPVEAALARLLVRR